jgi:hypothetical protein
VGHVFRRIALRDHPEDLQFAAGQAGDDIARVAVEFHRRGLIGDREGTAAYRKPDHLVPDNAPGAESLGLMRTVGNAAAPEAVPSAAGAGAQDRVAL